MLTLSPDEARRWMLTATGLGPRQPLDAPTLLAQRRCIQLDPLAPIAPNADLVAMARTTLRSGELERGLFPGRAFEHYAKERCLLPPEAFPAWRRMAERRPDQRVPRRAKRIEASVLDEVLDEVRQSGPVAVRDLADRGQIEPLDWHGWKGTAKATTLAVEVLWLRCQLVVVGRNPRVVDLPSRALPEHHDAPAPEDPEGWMLQQRVEAMGLLPSRDGPWWGQLRDDRKGLCERLVEQGLLTWVSLPGTRRRWLAPAGFTERAWVPPSDEMRVLGPLDPLIWDRDLVQRAFDFEYLWEVYKPADQRRWGWYVCPLLHRGRLVGRFEGKRAADGSIDVLGLWPGDGFERDAFEQALAGLREE
jgi:uncharacterized protein YcaQ